jgi:hypothetical protein
MSILIEGLAFPLDSINVNGWGVPASEKENAIESLKSSVIRVCTRADPHICDLFEDPFAEIGRITDAYEKDGGIYAKGIITDSAAEAKITEGTWGTSWSVFGYEDSNTDGFSQGFEARSMALVQNPAWEVANWAIVAARAAGAKNRKPVSSASNVYTIFDDSKKTNKKSASNKRKGDPMADPEQDPLKQILEWMAEHAGPETPGEEGEGGGIPEALAASIKALEKQAADKEARIAALEKQLSTAIPADKFPEMLAAGIAEDKEKEKRAAAYARFAAVRLERGLETKEEDYKALAASDFERSITELETLRPVAGGAQYPAGNNPVQAGADTGIYDPHTRSWKAAGAQ